MSEEQLDPQDFDNSILPPETLSLWKNLLTFISNFLQLPKLYNQYRDHILKQLDNLKALDAQTRQSLKANVDAYQKQLAPLYILTHTAKNIS